MDAPDAEAFQRRMDQEWDLSLWFSTIKHDHPRAHPEGIGFTDVPMSTAHDLKWATNKEAPHE
jgi:hypothetical protein